MKSVSLLLFAASIIPAAEAAKPGAGAFCKLIKNAYFVGAKAHSITIYTDNHIYEHPDWLHWYY